MPVAITRGDRSVAISGGMRPPSVSWWLFVAALVVEFFLFDRFGSHRVTGLYPRWNDQIQYLSEAYTGFEYARSHGLAAGLWHTLTNRSAQGTLHDFAALLAFWIAGPSRSAALALNMLALIAWQIALFAAVTKRTRSHGLALLAAMLPVALRGPWENGPGSAYDFRLDHLAMCALGVTGAIAMLTDGLRSRAASVLFGCVIATTLLTRFLTGTYFVLIFAATILWCIFGADRKRRTLNVILAAGIAAALAGPIFWLNRETVWNYYYVGHYVGPESAIRNQNFGLGRSLAFVWGEFAERHVGLFFAVFAAMVALILAAIRLRTGGSAAAEPARAAKNYRVADAAFIGATFLLAPAIILTLHPQKSPVVLSALAPGVILLVTAGWLAISGRPHSAARSERYTTVVAAVATVGALVYFAGRQLRPADDPATIANLRVVNAVADHVLARSEAAKLDPIRIAVDHITDAVDAQVMRVICYERHGVWRNFDMTLPTGIAEPDEQLVWERIQMSDFVFVTADGTTGQYPYDRKLATLRPAIKTWCDSHLRAAKQFTLSGRTVVLYERPTPQ